MSRIRVCTKCGQVLLRISDRKKHREDIDESESEGGSSGTSAHEIATINMAGRRNTETMRSMIIRSQDPTNIA